MVPLDGFWQQYTENLRNRRPLWQRLLRLLFAFVLAIGIGSVCYFVDWLTGSRTMALVVGVPLILCGAAIWWIFLSILDSRTAPAAGTLPGAFVPDPKFGPPPAYAASAYPPKAAPPSSSGAGWVVALLAVLSLVALSCCGGMAALVSMIGFRVQAAPAAPPGFEMPALPTPMAGPMGGPFGDMHREQQKHFEDMIRRQEEQLREMERRQRQFGP